MEPEGCELPVGARWSWRAVVIDLIDAFNENLKMHQNYKVYQQLSFEQTALEIETLTEG